MLYHLLVPLSQHWGALNVFRYPSFRIIGAALTSLLIMFIFFPHFINYLKKKQYGESNVREDTPERHKAKSGTPTMGGIFILLSLLISTLLWADLSNAFVWAVMLITFGFGTVGFSDDYLKLHFHNSKGLPGRFKIIFELIILCLVAVLIWAQSNGYIPFLTPLPFDSKISLPFVAVESFNPDITWWAYIPFAFLAIIGTSNALNLTDGLDGLAIGPTIVSAVTFLILSYAAGSVLADFNIAYYLRIPHMVGTSELAVFCAAMAGAGLGFLWYNTYPATVFMGDVGSLALGGALGAVAVFTKNEFLSVIIHGIFVMEALSVITQVTSFKLTGKRIFKMAPIHHHFELKGWAEPKIIVRFWLVSIILALVAMASLKVR